MSTFLQDTDEYDEEHALLGFENATIASHGAPRRSLSAARSPRSKRYVICKNTPRGQLMPSLGKTILTMQATGNRRFWCLNGQLKRTGRGYLYGQNQAILKSRDGQWIGHFEGRLKDGWPQFSLINKLTGVRRVVVAEVKAKAERKPLSKGSLPWDRRKAVLNSGPSPKISWVLRLNTTGGLLPTSCVGNSTVNVPFKAVYQFVAC